MGRCETPNGGLPMTPDEQQMIQDLFQRLASQGRVAKDPQADRVINDGLRATPDAVAQLREIHGLPQIGGD